jgi:hypothetical protein
VRSRQKIFCQVSIIYYFCKIIGRQRAKPCNCKKLLKIVNCHKFSYNPDTKQ